MGLWQVFVAGLRWRGVIVRGVSYDYAATKDAEAESLEGKITAATGSQKGAACIAEALQWAWAEGVVEGIRIGTSMYRTATYRRDFRRDEPVQPNDPTFRRALEALASAKSPFVSGGEKKAKSASPRVNALHAVGSTQGGEEHNR